MNLIFDQSDKKKSYENVLKCGENNIEEHILYYRSRIPRRRILSNIIRTLVLLLMAIGILLPIFGSGMDSSADLFGFNRFQLSLGGYYILVLAGLVFAIDQYFMISRSWMRFTVTMQALEDIKCDFNDEWNNNFHDEAQMNQANFPKAIALKTKYTDKARQERQRETSEWVEDLTSAISKISARLAQAEKTMEAKMETLIKDKIKDQDAAAKAGVPGAIRVTIANPLQYVDGSMSLSLEGPADRKDTIPPGTSKHAFSKLPIGIYVIRFEATKTDASGKSHPAKASDVVSLAGGQKEDVSF